MKKLYISLLLLPVMAFGADAPFLLDEPRGNFPFIGRIDLQGVELDPEVQEVLYGAEEQSVVGDEVFILLSENLDGTDFASQNRPELPELSSDSEDGEGFYAGRPVKRRRLHDYQDDMADLPCLNLSDDEIALSAMVLNNMHDNAHYIAESSEGQADAQMPLASQPGEFMRNAQEVDMPEAREDVGSNRFKSAACEKIAKNSSFIECFKKKRNSSKKPSIQSIWEKWQWRHSKDGISLADVQDWVVWTAQHEQDGELKKLALACSIKYKTVRMNDAFKVFLLKEFSNCKWELTALCKLWNQQSSQQINRKALKAYLLWAMKHESSKDMRKLALKYHEMCNRFTTKNKMQAIQGLKDFFDKHYDHNKGLSAQGPSSQARRLSKKWNLMHPDKPVAHDVFERYMRKLRESATPHS